MPRWFLLVNDIIIIFSANETQRRKRRRKEKQFPHERGKKSLDFSLCIKQKGELLHGEKHVYTFSCDGPGCGNPAITKKERKIGLSFCHPVPYKTKAFSALHFLYISPFVSSVKATQNKLQSH